MLHKTVQVILGWEVRMATKKHDKPIARTTAGKDANYKPTAKGAGMTAKGREAYNAKNNSNLKAPAPNPKTKADAGRKASFCARMSAVKGPMKDDNGKPTRKAAALKNWNC